MSDQLIPLIEYLDDDQIIRDYKKKYQLILDNESDIIAIIRIKKTTNHNDSCELCFANRIKRLLT